MQLFYENCKLDSIGNQLVNKLISIIYWKPNFVFWTRLYHLDVLLRGLKISISRVLPS